MERRDEERVEILRGNLYTQVEYSETLFSGKALGSKQKSYGSNAVCVDECSL